MWWVRVLTEMLTFSAMARLSQSFLHVPNRVYMREMDVGEVLAIMEQVPARPRRDSHRWRRADTSLSKHIGCS